MTLSGCINAPCFTWDCYHKYQRTSLLQFYSTPLFMALYKCVTPMQEYVILSSDEPYRSVFLASNIFYPLSLYQHNVADAACG